MAIPIDHDAEAHARTHRQAIRKVADKIEAGEPLNGIERGMAAVVLREVADTIQAPGKQGPKPKLPPGEVAMEFAILVNLQGWSKDSAQGELAGKYGVSKEAIRKCLKKHGDEALAIVPRKQP